MCLIILCFFLSIIANGTKQQACENNGITNGDFRPISSLAKANGHIFNTQVASQKQVQRDSNVSNPQFMNGTSSSSNPNQLAFNYGNLIVFVLKDYGTILIFF